MQSPKALADSADSASPSHDAHTRRRAAVFDVTPLDPAAWETTTTVPEPLRRWEVDLVGTTAAHAPGADPQANAHDYVSAVLGGAADDLAAVRRALDTLVACVVAHHVPVDLAPEPATLETKLMTVPGNPTGGNALRAVRERRLHRQHQEHHRGSQPQQQPRQQQPVRSRFSAHFELPASAVPASTLCLSSDGGGAFTSFSDAIEDSLGSSDASRHFDTCAFTFTAAGGVDLDASGDAAVEDLNQYVLLERLGKGAQGTVFLAMDTANDELRAIKAVERPPPGARMSPAKRKVHEDLAREVAIMKRLRHRNVVALHEVIDDPAHDTMYLVMQYVEHGPLAAMTPEGAVSATVEPAKLVSYARQICAGLQYLHQHGVIHRDIKPENILLGANDTVYLADFGVSAEAKRVAGTHGTPAFLAPELLKLRTAAESAPSTTDSEFQNLNVDDATATDADGEAVDVWALGITLYALLYGKLPWEFTDARDLFEAIQRRPIELRPQAAMQRSTPSIFDAGASYVSVASIRGRSTPNPAPLHLPLAPAQPRAMRPGTAGCRRAFTASITDAPPIREGPAAVENVAATLLPTFDEFPGDAAPPTQGDLIEVCPSPGFSYSGPRGRSQLPMPSAAADEGWRRVLHGMLQRDPRRRTKVSELRRQLASLDSTCAAASVSSPDVYVR